MIYAQQIFAAIQIELFEIDEILMQGDRVTVLGREINSAVATGKKYDISWVHMRTVRGGLVQHLREYNDTSAMALAFS